MIVTVGKRMSDADLKGLSIDELRRKVAQDEIGSTVDAENVPIGSDAVPVSLEVDDIGSLDDVLDELGNEDIVIVPRVVMGKRVGIRLHDVFSILDLETRRLTVESSGKLKRDPSREVKLGLALELHTSIYRNVGTREKEKWEKWFPEIKSAESFCKKPRANDLVDALMAAVYSVNEALSPANKYAAMQQSNG